ncbi:MAG TPA: hypothetical protein VEH84_02800 [Alphaproteobacteria bacterium]|nr:hypothetical protein [Alphaproteobacteria bacterium]
MSRFVFKDKIFNILPQRDGLYRDVSLVVFGCFLTISAEAVRDAFSEAEKKHDSVHALSQECRHYLKKISQAIDNGELVDIYYGLSPDQESALKDLTKEKDKLYEFLELHDGLTIINNKYIVSRTEVFTNESIIKSLNGAIDSNPSLHSGSDYMKRKIDRTQSDMEKAKIIAMAQLKDMASRVSDYCSFLDKIQS